jgi:ribosomal protein S18 acetylase RimI-like enzyme
MSGALVAGVDIRTLESLDVADLQRIADGYLSLERYEVSRTATREWTAITLNLVELDQPYVKQWAWDNDELSHYVSMVDEQFSVGAFVGGQLIGIGLAERRAWNATLWVWEFHVHRDWRRQGVGRQLMEALAQLARDAGLRCIGLETQNTNVPGIDAYRRLGFEIDGIDLSFYTNTDTLDGEVAIFMKRRLV